MNATHFVTESERAVIEQAAAEAEKCTSAEIVCAVATESGRYDRAESIVGLCGALVALAVAALLNDAPAGLPGSWSIERGLSLGWQCFAVVAGFVLGSIAASYFHPLRNFFTMAREMEEETNRAASHVFAVHRLGATKSRGGVLLYVSLFERRVIVLADKAVMDAVGDGFLRELRDLAVKRLHDGCRVETFVETIRMAADRLALVLPVRADDADELSNRLLIFRSRP
jgi:putative membrane protein